MFSFAMKKTFNSEPLMFPHSTIACRFLLLFLSKPPPRFLLETKGSASIEDSFGFSALCDLPETIFWKSKSSSQFFVFWGFRLSKMGFCCFQLGKKWFSSCIRILTSGIFRHCKIDEISTVVLFCIFEKLLFEAWAGRRLGPFPACFTILFRWNMLKFLPMFLTLLNLAWIVKRFFSYTI